MSRSTGETWGVIKSWDKSRLNVDHLMHGNWVACFKTWRRRSLFSGRAQTCGNQSNVWNSQRLLRVILEFETKILRSDTCAQVNFMSVAPTLQNLRIGLKRRQSGKSKVPTKQRGCWPKECWNSRSMMEQHSSHLRKIGACLHQLLNLRNENLLSTPECQCTWSAKKGLEWCWNGYFDGIVQSYDGRNRQWRSANAWRGNCVCQRIGYILDNESPRKNASNIVDSNYNNTEVLADPHEEQASQSIVKVFAARSKAKAKTTKERNCWITEHYSNEWKKVDWYWTSRILSLCLRTFEECDQSSSTQ